MVLWFPVYSQLIDANGSQYSSLQQALAIKPTSLRMISKIIGKCEGVISKPFLLNGNGYKLTCIDSGLIQSNSNMTIQNVEVTNFNLQVLESGRLNMTQVVFVSTTQIELMDKSVSSISNCTFVESDAKILINNEAQIEITGIYQTKSSVSVSANDISIVEVNNWTSFSSSGQLFESKLESSIKISNLIVNNHKCKDGESVALVSSRDQSTLTISQLFVTNLDNSLCSIGALSVTSGGNMTISESIVSGANSKLFYLDESAFLTVLDSKFSFVNVPLNNYIATSKGESTIAFNNVTFIDIDGSFYSSESSSFNIVNSKFIGLKTTRRFIFLLNDNAYMEFNNNDVSFSSALFSLDTSASLFIGQSHFSFISCQHTCIEAFNNAIVTMSSNTFHSITFATFLNYLSTYNRQLTTTNNVFSFCKGFNVFELTNTIFNSTLDNFESNVVSSIYYSNDQSTINLEIINANNNGNTSSIGTIIHSSGKVTIRNSQIANNTAQLGAVYVHNADLKIENTKFNFNSAADGGSLYISGRTVLSNKNSSIMNGRAIRGGAIYFNNSLLTSSLQMNSNVAIQGNNQASNPFNFDATSGNSTMINITLVVKDRFNSKFISQPWDPISLINLVPLSEFKFIGTTIQDRKSVV